jgi:hypothetical protein
MQRSVSCGGSSNAPMRQVRQRAGGQYALQTFRAPALYLGHAETWLATFERYVRAARPGGPQESAAQAWAHNLNMHSTQEEARAGHGAASRCQLMQAAACRIE